MLGMRFRQVSQQGVKYFATVFSTPFIQPGQIAQHPLIYQLIPSHPLQRSQMGI
jgi:hypothetical protein